MRRFRLNELSFSRRVRDPQGFGSLEKFHAAHRSRRADAIIPALKVNSKKQALQELAAKAAQICRPERADDLRNSAAAREARLDRRRQRHRDSARQAAEARQAVRPVRAARRPVDFEALDGQPVDLIFLLLAPEGAGADHLKALARVARLLRDPDVARKLRESRDAEALYAVLAMPSATAA